MSQVINSLQLAEEIGIDAQTLTRWRRSGLVIPAKNTTGRGNSALFWKKDIPLLIALMDLKDLRKPDQIEELANALSEWFYQDVEPTTFDVSYGRVRIVIDLDPGGSEDEINTQ